MIEELDYGFAGLPSSLWFAELTDGCPLPDAVQPQALEAATPAALQSSNDVVARLNAAKRNDECSVPRRLPYERPLGQRVTKPLAAPVERARNLLQICRELLNLWRYYS